MVKFSGVRVGASAAAVLAVVLCTLPLSSAQAASEVITGQTPLQGTQNYSVARYHAGGTMKFTPSFVAPCGGSTLLWARNAGGTRITSSPAILPGVVSNFTRYPGGADIIPAVSFRLSANINGEGCPSADQHFTGTLVY